MLKLNIGCGTILKEGYVNVDLYVPHPNVVQAPADNLPYPANSVDEIFSSHFLEHVSHLLTVKHLTEWHRVLKPGGVLQLVLPNLEWCLRNWLSKPETERWGFPLHTIFGLQIHPGEFHNNGFTPTRLRQLLTGAGFAVTSAESRYDPEHAQDSIYATAIKRTPQQRAAASGVRTIKQGNKVYKFRA